MRSAIRRQIETVALDFMREELRALPTKRRGRKSTGLKELAEEIAERAFASADPHAIKQELLSLHSKAMDKTRRTSLRIMTNRYLLAMRRASGQAE